MLRRAALKGAQHLFLVAEVPAQGVAAGGRQQALLAAQLRRFSSNDGHHDTAAPAAAAAPHTEHGAPPAETSRSSSGASGGIFEYEGPFAPTVRRLKKLSLFSCACTSLGSPLLVAMDAATAASTMGGKVAIAATLSGFGFFTTGLLHWFCKPYVHRLTYDPSTDTASAVTLTLLGKERVTRFSPSQAEAPQGLTPLSTFQVGGVVMYLDTNNFGDKALLARLQPADEHAGQEEGQQQQQQQQTAAGGAAAGGAAGGVAVGSSGGTRQQQQQQQQQAA